MIDTLTPGYLSSQIYIFQTKFLHDVFLKGAVPDTDSFCFLGMDLRKKAIIWRPPLPPQGDDVIYI